jgi:hypothetical protein
MESAEANNFVTWIGGVDRAATGAALIAQMKACNLSFGNPYYTRGGLWIGVETDSAGYMLAVDDRGVSPSGQLYLTVAAIDSTGTGHAPKYSKIGERLGRGMLRRVGMCEPSFARVEAWAAGRPLAFSNVVTLPPVPALCPAPAP